MNPQHNYQAPRPPKLTPRDRAFWTKGPGVILTTVVVGGIIAAVLWLAGMGPSSSPGPGGGEPVQVQLTGCSADDFAAKAVLTVTNTGSRARTATIGVEYRDADGARLDTDTAYVRDIAPGDTVKHDETTILDGAPSGAISCVITSVDSY